MNDEVASASQDRFRHSAVVRHVLGACNEATGLLRNHNARLRPSNQVSQFVLTCLD